MQPAQSTRHLGGGRALARPRRGRDADVAARRVDPTRVDARAPARPGQTSPTNPAQPGSTQPSPAEGRLSTSRRVDVLDGIVESSCGCARPEHFLARRSARPKVKRPKARAQTKRCPRGSALARKASEVAELAGKASEVAELAGKASEIAEPATRASKKAEVTRKASEVAELAAKNIMGLSQKSYGR